MSADIASSRDRAHDGSIRRIVVATDFSDASAGALRLASDLARTFGAELVVVHVLPDLGEVGSVKATRGMDSGNLLERQAGEAATRLRHLESTLGRGHLHASVRCGAAAREIIRLAGAVSADLIVLRAPGPTAPHGDCVEPIAVKVRTRAQCPVIVAPAPHHRQAASAPLDLRFAVCPTRRM